MCNNHRKTVITLPQKGGVRRSETEAVGGNRLDIESGEDLFRETGQVIGDDVPRTGNDRHRKDLAVANFGWVGRPTSGS